MQKTPFTAPIVTITAFISNTKNENSYAIELIGTTTTQSGLRVEAQLDTNMYPTKIQVSDEEMAALKITPHTFHGEWNYTITHVR